MLPMLRTLPMRSTPPMPPTAVASRRATARLATALAGLLVLANAGSAVAQLAISAPFDTDYSFVSLGSVPGLPTSYGGLTFKKGDPNTILIGGGANSSGGALYQVQVVRDETQHVTGFTGTATVYAEGAYNDGGVTYGPGDVLFMARWPVNELGQIRSGSHTTDRIIAMGPLGVASSLSALAFVPQGFPGAGHLKLVTYSSGDWYDSTVSPDGQGSYDVVDVAHRTQIGGGPEGFVYVPPGSPQFPDYSRILVAEYAAGRIASYTIDAAGDPIPATRVDFLTGLSGAEGATVDPLTGDFLFSTFGGLNQVLAVRGFAVPNGCALCASAPGCLDTCDEQAGACRNCGHPVSNQRCTVNAVVVLQASLALRDCELCTCDVDSSGTVTATDALKILRSCVNLPSALVCPDPGSSTTTTIGQ